MSRVRVRLWLLVLPAGGLLLAAAGLGLLHGAQEARHELEGARAGLPALRAALERGDAAQVHVRAQELQAHSSSARRATDGLLWEVARWVPVLGRTPAAVQALTRSVDDLATSVLPPVADVALDLSGGRGDAAPRSLDLSGLAAAAPVLEQALLDVRGNGARLAEVDRRLVVRSVSAAHDELTTELALLERVLDVGAGAARLLVPMLGDGGPRHYFVAFQANAEARGTGGLVGAYGVLTADAGRLHFSRLGSDEELVGLPAPEVDLGPAFEALHGPHHRIWQNTNTTAHFPYAARLWLDMWEQSTGQRLDGAVATDPVALARLLSVVGPVDLPSGDRVTADNAVALTMRDAYARFADDNAARKDYLVAVARAVADSVLGDGLGDPQGLLRALREISAERRLLVYSEHQAEQELLLETSLAGAVPQQPGPFAWLVVNNGAGNKLDYYLRRSLRYALGRCEGDRRAAVIGVVLHNDVPDGELPSYVDARLDRRGQQGGDGSTLVNAALYLARGAVVSGATLDGQPVGVHVLEERGHPVLVLPVELARQQRRELVVHLDEPAVDAAPVVLEQPLVQPQSTRVEAPACAL